MVDAAQRNFAAARRLTDKMSAKDHLAYLEQTSVAVDQAQWARARTLARSGLDLAKKQGGIDSRYFPLPMAVTEWLGGSQEDALQIASDAAEQSLQALEQKFDADAVDDAATALAAALLAQRLGDRSLPERVLARVEKHPAVMAVPRLTEWATVVRANQLRSAGRAKEALEALKPLITGHERYQTRAALMEAYADAGDNAAALEQARWLQRRRGLAYVELECGHCLQALNVADSNLATLREAELLNQSGNSSGAKQGLGKLRPALAGRSLARSLAQATRGSLNGIQLGRSLSHSAGQHGPDLITRRSYASFVARFSTLQSINASGSGAGRLPQAVIFAGIGDS